MKVKPLFVSGEWEVLKQERLSPKVDRATWHCVKHTCTQVGNKRHGIAYLCPDCKILQCTTCLSKEVPDAIRDFIFLIKAKPVTSRCTGCRVAHDRGLDPPKGK